MPLFRSALIGFVTMVVTCSLAAIGTVFWLARSLRSDASPEGTDIGWDLVSLYRNCPHKAVVLAVPAASFAIGFLWSHRRPPPN